MTPRAAGAALVLLAAAAVPIRAQTFFESDSVIAITLRADLRALFNDRDTSKVVWREATISWAGADGPRTVPLRVRTRGIFRRGRCDVPPIRLRFVNDSVRGTPWHGLHHPKLTTHCMDRDEYEQNTLQEYAIYRAYRLFTPLSYSVRLLRITWEDVNAGRRPVTRYGFLIEDPDRFIERLHATQITRPGTRFGTVEPANAALVGVFQYFVANTDWSLPGLHNMAVLRQDSVVRIVPYDFDWSGVIDARYATPAPQLRIRSVRERVYRGFCQDEAALSPVLERFVALKDSIAAIYRAVPGLEPRGVERSLHYYDEFYRDIRDRGRFIRDIVTPTCLH